MYTKILVPLDGSELAESALPYLEWFMKVSHVNEIVFLRVIEPFHVPGGIEGTIIPEERERIEQDAVKLAENYLSKITGRFKAGKIKIESLVKVGKPAKTVADYVAKSDVDLIILATHAFSGIRRLVSGSVADEILRAAQVPIFLVKREDWPPDK
jgi:nucleotide-binding universal stress UspA family protein